MKRQHPFLSPVGCLAAFVIVACMAGAVLLSGGAVFSPGRLTALAASGTRSGDYASHAEFENDCRLCHAPLRGVEAARCENCHTDVGTERATGTGLHSGFKNAGDCAACHKDHRGRDFDSSGSALVDLDHAALGFSLARHKQNYDRTPLAEQCSACHTSSGFAFDTATCADCHGARAPVFMVDHATAFGGDCLACHDGVDRTMGFDHAATDFPLEGAHASLECVACHTGPQVKDTSADCAACHAEPETHAGLFGADCAACHTTRAWTPARLDDAVFDHAATGFALTVHAQDFDGSPFACRACHTGEGFSFAEETCSDCHGRADAVFMTGHISAFGGDCMSCHDGTGNLRNFDHARVFVLDGAHATAECAACHVEQQFKGTPAECAACHAEPQIHAGVFGADCAACHTTQAWTPAQLTRHTFPLDHGEQGEVACAACHLDSYVEYTCYGCHEHRPDKIERKHDKEGISRLELPDCTNCHPTGREAEGRGDQGAGYWILGTGNQ